MPFMSVPNIVATDRDGLIFLLTNTDWMHEEGLKRFNVKSVFVCKLIRSLEGTDIVTRFVSNREIEVAAAKELEDIFPCLSEDQRMAASTLVYNGRKYVEHDRLVEQGFLPFTQGLIHQAFIEDKNIEFPGGRVAEVKRTKDGSIRAMVKGKRSSFYNTGDLHPARLIEKEKK